MVPNRASDTTITFADRAPEDRNSSNGVDVRVGGVTVQMNSMPVHKQFATC